MWFKDTIPGFVQRLFQQMGWSLTVPSWYSAVVVALGFAVVVLQIVIIHTATATKAAWHMETHLPVEHQ